MSGHVWVEAPGYLGPSTRASLGPRGLAWGPTGKSFQKGASLLLGLFSSLGRLDAFGVLWWDARGVELRLGEGRLRLGTR